MKFTIYLHTPHASQIKELLKKTSFKSSTFVKKLPANAIISSLENAPLQENTPLLLIDELDNEDPRIVDAIANGAQDYLHKNDLDAERLEQALTYAIEREHTQEALRELSLTDELTDLYNRRGFLQLAEQHLSYAKRYNRPFILISLDIDNFKEINDTYGHLAGDEALGHLAACHGDTAALAGARNDLGDSVALGDTLITIRSGSEDEG